MPCFGKAFGCPAFLAKRKCFVHITVLLLSLFALFIHYRLVSALQSSGIEALFPVQVAVWQQTIGSCGSERDLCICSPTGSGKTLAYALPIVQMLSSRVIRRLRALIVLPTRDLAIQVILYSNVVCMMECFAGNST